MTTVGLGRTLVLVADGIAREICSAEEAIWDLMQNRAFQREGTGEFCHSPSYEIEIPSVIQQFKYHKPKNSGRPRSLPLTPRNVCARDRWICAYQIEGVCAGRATTIDHVVPRSRGGSNDWENVVAACRPCNGKKGKHLLSEIGWESKIPPWRPTGAIARVLVHATRDEWIKYLI